MGRKKAQRKSRGSVFALASTGGYRAKYLNPERPGKYVTKAFKKGQRLMAENWLRSELKYVDACETDGVRYMTPRERELEHRHEREAHSVTFREYAEAFLENYRAADGSRITGAAMRTKRTAVGHLIDYFGDMKLTDITPNVINRFLDDKERYGEGRYSMRRAFQALKAIMRKASKPDGDIPPLIASNPCTQPVPRTRASQQARIPEVTPNELKVIADNMPDYMRIGVYVQAVFALRISELCALQVRDFDFKRRTLHIRHALARSNDDDTGELILADTKTEDSAADLPIPVEFIPELKHHIAAYTDWPTDGEGNPKANVRNNPAMFLRAKHSRIMNPNSLRNQFDRARVKAGRPDLHTHTLRATGITMASRNGTPKEAQVYGRHDDAGISLNLYQRANAEGLTRVSESVYKTLAPVGRTREVVQDELKTVEAQLKELRARRKALAIELKGMSE